MKKILPIIALILVMGSGVSFGQAKKTVRDPFQIYLRAQRHETHEPSFVQFSKECGVDLKTAHRHYGVHADDWKSVPNLKNPQQYQETDFLWTVEVWGDEKLAVLEIWYLDFESGYEKRNFDCIANGEISSIEVVNWGTSIGYDQLFKRKTQSEYSVALVQYINTSGLPIHPSKKQEKAVGPDDVLPSEKTWADLKLPDEFLK